MKGIDVSAWQHENGAQIDWPAVAGAGVQAAMIKLTEGTGYVNPYAAADAKAARAAGIRVGFYHFARPDLGNAAAAEVAYFVSHLAGVSTPGDLAPALDSEKQVKDLAAWNVAFLELMPQAVGYGDALQLPPARQWRIVESSSPPASTGGAWGIQYGTGSVAGIVGACDLDVFADPTPPAPAPGGEPMGVCVSTSQCHGMIGYDGSRFQHLDPDQFAACEKAGLPSIANDLLYAQLAGGGSSTPPYASADPVGFTPPAGFLEVGGGLQVPGATPYQNPITGDAIIVTATGVEWLPGGFGPSNAGYNGYPGNLPT